MTLPSLSRGGGVGRLRSAAGLHSSARPRRPRPPQAAGPDRAGPSTSEATSTASDERGADIPPPMLLLPRPATNEWLPPGAFLPSSPATLEPRTWTPWTSVSGTPHAPRYAAYGGPDPGRDPRRPLATWEETQAVERVYASIDTLAAAFHAQMAAMTATPAFPAWRRENPSYKPCLTGFLATALGQRRITVLLDTGATHCFICARLATTLGLAPSGEPGPSSVTTAAATGRPLELAAPVRIYLGLGSTFRESLSVPGLSRLPVAFPLGNMVVSLVAQVQVRIRRARLSLGPACSFHELQPLL